MQRLISLEIHKSLNIPKNFPIQIQINTGQMEIPNIVSWKIIYSYYQTQNTSLCGVAHACSFVEYSYIHTTLQSH